jgi:hypothetical protein
VGQDVKSLQKFNASAQRTRNIPKKKWTYFTGHLCFSFIYSLLLFFSMYKSLIAPEPEEAIGNKAFLFCLGCAFAAGRGQSLDRLNRTHHRDDWF